MEAQCYWSTECNENVIFGGRANATKFHIYLVNLREEYPATKRGTSICVFHRQTLKNIGQRSFQGVRIYMINPCPMDFQLTFGVLP
eukprot:1158844-Pelagomonas_calceolata.AAC.3